MPDAALGDGVRVQSVIGSRRSVIRPGDLIVAINGRRVTNVAQTISVAHSIRFETELTVSVVRDSHRLELRAQLSPNAYLGAEVQMRRGVVTVRRVAAGSPAADSHLRAGDVVVAVDHKHVSDVAALLAMLADHAPGERVRLEISREGRQVDLPAILGERPTQR
jgi:S1-C subfamily serine protease